MLQAINGRIVAESPTAGQQKYNTAAMPHTYVAL